MTNAEILAKLHEALIERAYEMGEAISEKQMAHAEGIVTGLADAIGIVKEGMKQDEP